MSKVHEKSRPETARLNERCPRRNIFVRLADVIIRCAHLLLNLRLKTDSLPKFGAIKQAGPESPPTGPCECY